jgi:23S rRNA (guanosine2251-2'-O)-methyltransferase
MLGRPNILMKETGKNNLILDFSMSKRTREYIYGLNPAFEVVRAGRRPVYEAWLNTDASDQPRMQKLLQVFKRADIPVQWVEKGRLNDLAGSRDHQGVVIKTRPYPYQNSDTLWSRSRYLVLDNVEDPHNVGGILRSAEIFGFNTVFLSEKNVPDIYPSVVKVSAGATEFLDIAKDRLAEAYVRNAKERGISVLALDEEAGTDIHNVRTKLPAGPLMVVIGGEDMAVSDAVLGLADFRVSIMQHGRIHSLNAAVAAGIALYELT